MVMLNSKLELSFISKKIEGNKLSLRFEKPTDFHYEAGQYASFVLPQLGALQKSRVFSYASAPDEDFIMIGTQLSDPPSDYKQALLDMKVGETITMKGPYGDFINTQNNVKKVFIGLGIGVTPFRSIFLDAQTLEKDTLIYSGKSDLLFMDEFQELTTKGLTIMNPLDRNELAQAIDSIVIEPTTEFYVSGSMKGVTNVSKLLSQKKVKSSHVFSDVFSGY